MVRHGVTQKDLVEKLVEVQPEVTGVVSALAAKACHFQPALADSRPQEEEEEEEEKEEERNTHTHAHCPTQHSGNNNNKEQRGGGATS